MKALGAFTLGLALGYIIGTPKPRPPMPEPIIAPGTEARIDLATCEARMAQAIIAERIRLTGRPNPPAWR